MLTLTQSDTNYVTKIMAVHSPGRTHKTFTGLTETRRWGLGIHVYHEVMIRYMCEP